MPDDELRREDTADVDRERDQTAHVGIPELASSLQERQQRAACQRAQEEEQLKVRLEQQFGDALKNPLNVRERGQLETFRQSQMDQLQTRQDGAKQLRDAATQLDKLQVGANYANRPQSDQDGFGQLHERQRADLQELVNRMEQQLLNLQDQQNADLRQQRQTVLAAVTPQGSRDLGHILAEQQADSKAMQEQLGRMKEDMDLRSRELLMESKLKELALDNSRKEGGGELVKVVARESGPKNAVSGYVTEAKYVEGRTPAELQKVLGLPRGELAEGALAHRLDGTPRPDQFEPRSYTQLPGGKPYERTATQDASHKSYEPGLGAPQWQLTVMMPVASVQQVEPDQGYRRDKKRRRS